jgi:hypothetical protein
VNVTAEPSARGSFLGRAALFAVVVGVAVGIGGRLAAGPSCGPSPDGVMASCDDLVTDLAARMGVLVALATLVMIALSAGLLRTAERMDADRRELEREAGA